MINKDPLSLRSALKQLPCSQQKKLKFSTKSVSAKYHFDNGDTICISKSGVAWALIEFCHNSEKIHRISYNYLTQATYNFLQLIKGGHVSL